METTQLSVIAQAQQKWELACKEASGLQLFNNFSAAFTAVNMIKLLREALTDEVMVAVFMPLMNTKVGFLTDRNGKTNSRGESKQPYSISIVRDAIIDGVSIGLSPTGNQMNIIAERMYPTKEGYTSLLRRLGVKYLLDVGYDKGSNSNFAEIPVKITYEHENKKNGFSIVATVKKDSYSSHDQLRGKAERRAKRALYEYITGCDFGDADASENTVIDTTYEDVSAKVETEIKENANAETLIINAEQQPEEEKIEQEPEKKKAPF